MDSHVCKSIIDLTPKQPNDSDEDFMNWLKCFLKLWLISEKHKNRLK